VRIAFTPLARGSWGASELLWALAAERALAEGHDVAVLTFGPRGRVAERALALGTAGARLFLRSPSLARPRLAWDTLVGVMRRLASWRPDVIVVNQGATYQAAQSWVMRTFLGRAGVPYVLLCHGNLDEYRLNDADRERARSMFRGARWTSFPAEENRRSTERQIAATVDRAWVVRNPVNVATSGALPWPRAGEAALATVARLDVRFKGHDLLLDALRESRWQSRPWRLNVYGDGPDEGYLRELAAHFGLTHRVSFHGHVADVERVWRENHLLVLPSRSEGMPLVVVEAMLCGRACVATDVGGLREWIDEGVEGFLAEAPSVRALGRALERAWEARPQWQQMGMAARARALRQVDHDPAGTLLAKIVGAAQSGADTPKGPPKETYR
jgi:glycosyltransferase involved in cell wall biosynthesis